MLTVAMPSTSFFTLEFYLLETQSREEFNNKKLFDLSDEKRERQKVDKNLWLELEIVENIKAQSELIGAKKSG